MVNVEKMMLTCPTLLKLVLRPVLAAIVIAIALVALSLPTAQASSADMLQIKVYGVDGDGKITVFNNIKSTADYQNENMLVDKNPIFPHPGNVVSLQDKKSTSYIQGYFCPTKNKMLKDKDGSLATESNSLKCQKTIGTVASGLAIKYQVRKAENKFIQNDNLVLDMKASLVDLLSMKRMPLDEVEGKYIESPETRSGTAEFSVSLKKGEAYTYPLMAGNASSNSKAEKKNVYIEVTLI